MKKVVKALKALSNAPTSGDSHPIEQKDEEGVPIDDVLYGLNKHKGLLGSPFSRAELSKILAHLTDEGRVFMAGSMWLYEHCHVRALTMWVLPHAPENADDIDMVPQTRRGLGRAERKRRRRERRRRGLQRRRRVLGDVAHAGIRRQASTRGKRAGRK